MLRVLLVCVLFACTWTIPADAAGIAVVKYIQGRVQVEHEGHLRDLSEGAELASGDLLITGADGAVGIVFNDGSLLSLQKKSYLKIRQYSFEPLEKQFDFHLFLKKGGALFESGKIGTLAPDKFLFEIPSGTIGIRGTRFLVEVN